MNTVDIDRGARVVWGLPGLRDVSVRDAVYASCALPGFFPPGKVADRTCIDGGVVDNLPVSMAAQFADLIIAVDVGSSDASQKEPAADQGFATIYMRAATMMMHALQQYPLERWQGPPMVLVRPRVNDANWLSFTDTEANIDAGYAAATQALARYESYWEPGLGVPAPACAGGSGRRQVHRLRHLRGTRTIRDGARRHRQGIRAHPRRGMVARRWWLRARVPDIRHLGDQRGSSRREQPR